MSKTGNILPECEGDTVLVKMLGYKQLNHQYGIHEVLKMMKEHLGNQMAVGIIDHDKTIKNDYFDAFILQQQSGNLTLKKHPTRKHFLILISPALEKFILESARLAGIPAAEFPFDEKRLKQVCKSQDATDNQPLKQFLNRIIQKKSPGTETLKSWLLELLGEEF